MTSGDVPSTDVPVTGGRSTDLRMARLHLRLGSLELARAEFEAFAGAGSLDPDALLDLAEVRWRTGDMSGAGVAAQAYLGEGGEAVLALVIAAEASAAMGRPTEARRLASQALERADVPLDRLFAGIPRSGVWPIEPDERALPAGELFAIPATRPATPPPVVEGGRESHGGLEAEPARTPAASVAAAAAGSTTGFWDEVDPPAGAVLPAAPVTGLDPTAELAAARRELLAGRRASAASRLAVVLRLAPQLAPQVLEAVGSSTAPADDAGLEIVRGDACRLVGREDEARHAYAAAAAALLPGVEPRAGADDRPVRDRPAGG